MLFLLAEVICFSVGRVSKLIHYWWKGWWLDKGFERTYYCSTKNSWFASGTSRSQGEVVTLSCLIYTLCACVCLFFRYEFVHFQLLCGCLYDLWIRWKYSLQGTPMTHPTMLNMQQFLHLHILTLQGKCSTERKWIVLWSCLEVVLSEISFLFF